MDKFSRSCSLFLCLPYKRSVVLAQSSTEAPTIMLEWAPLEVVDRFCYLDSVLSKNLPLDGEIDIRIGEAATMFGRLSARVCHNKYLTNKNDRVPNLHVLVSLGNSLYVDEVTSTNMKVRLYNMDKDLVMDSRAKFNGILNLRRFFQDTTPFEVGDIVCKIRQKYARMVLLYSRSLTFSDEWSHLKDIDHLLEIQNLYRYVDNLARMIKIWEDDDDYIYHPPKETVKKPTKEDLARQVEKMKSEMKPKKGVWISQPDDFKSKYDQRSRHNEKDIVPKADVMEDGFDTDF